MNASPSKSMQWRSLYALLEEGRGREGREGVRASLRLSCLSRPSCLRSSDLIEDRGVELAGVVTGHCHTYERICRHGHGRRRNGRPHVPVRGVRHDDRRSGALQAQVRAEDGYAATEITDLASVSGTLQHLDFAVRLHV